MKDRTGEEILITVVIIHNNFATLCRKTEFCTPRAMHTGCAISSMSSVKKKEWQLFRRNDEAYSTHIRIAHSLRES